MVSILPYWKKPARWLKFAKWLPCGMVRLGVLFVLLGMGSTSAWADGITLRSAQLHPQPGGYVLDARFDINLSENLLEALRKGVPLYFVSDFEVTRPRWLAWKWQFASGFGPTDQQVQKLTYMPLTGEYRVSSGAIYRAHPDLETALLDLGRVHWPRLLASDNEPSRLDEARIRLRLDATRIAKPLQLDLLGSSEWRLSSAWYNVLVEAGGNG